MSRERPAFRQADVARAFKGAMAAGVSVSRVEIAPDGKIVIIVGLPAAAEPSNLSPLEKWRRERDARAA